MEQSEESKDLAAARALFVVWVILLIPWFPIAGSSFMVMDPGYSLSGLLYILSVWSYGVTVVGAFALRRRSRKAVLLPLLILAAILASVLFDWVMTYRR